MAIMATLFKKAIFLDDAHFGYFSCPKLDKKEHNELKITMSGFSERYFPDTVL